MATPTHDSEEPALEAGAVPQRDSAWRQGQGTARLRRAASGQSPDRATLVPQWRVTLGHSPSLKARWRL